MSKDEWGEAARIEIWIDDDDFIHCSFKTRHDTHTTERRPSHVVTVTQTTQQSQKRLATAASLSYGVEASLKPHQLSIVHRRGKKG
jgi:hypothetical protein